MELKEVEIELDVDTVDDSAVTTMGSGRMVFKQPMLDHQQVVTKSGWISKKTKQFQALFVRKKK